MRAKTFRWQRLTTSDARPYECTTLGVGTPRRKLTSYTIILPHCSCTFEQRGLAPCLEYTWLTSSALCSSSSRLVSHYKNVTEWDVTVAAGLSRLTHDCDCLADRTRICTRSSCEYDPELYIHGWEHDADDCFIHDKSVTRSFHMQNLHAMCRACGMLD